jgi:hypothetical protein
MEHPLLVQGGRVLDLVADPHQPREADILIENGIIAAISAPGMPPAVNGSP